MKISTYVTNKFINFTSINLAQPEKEKSDMLIFKMSEEKDNARLKSELLDVFDKHIKQEAEIKSRGIYYKSEVLQKMYLNFFEALENVKDITTEKLIEILDKTEPGNNELKEEYRYKTVSLEKTLTSAKDSQIKDFLNPPNTLVYKSDANEQEREQMSKKIQDLAESTKLKEREKNVLKGKGKGVSTKEIAEENGVSRTIINNLYNNAIAKIQNEQGLLPEKFNDIAESLINRYNLKIEKNEIINTFINNTNTLSKKPEKLFEYIEKTAALLKISPEDLITAELRQPALFLQKPETIFDNVSKTSKLLGTKFEDFTKAALKQPQLFYQKPETILGNINRTSKSLNIKSEDFTKAALKQPVLFCLKPETILKKLNNASKLLQITPEDFIQAAFKQPALFLQKPETIFDNVSKNSKLLGINPKDFTENALKMPQLFCLKPETLVKKVKIIQYYKKIQNKDSNKIVTSLQTDGKLYETILNYLVKKSDGLKTAIDKKNFVRYLSNSNRIYNFEIPNHEVAVDFVEFAKEFSDKNFGKQIFSFKIT